MRSTIICLISLLLTPTLVASKQWLPPPSNVPPVSLPSQAGPEHGDFVRYQGIHGSNVGIVVGQQQAFGNINIAPLAPHSAHPPRRPIIPLHNQVVTAHPGQVANTGHSDPHMATQIQGQYEHRLPMASHVAGAVHGSPIHQLMRGTRYLSY